MESTQENHLQTGQRGHRGGLGPDLEGGRDLRKSDKCREDPLKPGVPRNESVWGLEICIFVQIAI